MEKKRTQKISELGLLLAVAVMLGYVEAILPVSIGVPGVKLGLANCAVLFVLYRYGGKKAAIVSILRTVIIAALFTNLSMLLYSLSGALCSIAVMNLVKRVKYFSIYGVSMAGGVAHNLAQLVVAGAISGILQAGEWWLTQYLPILMICGLLAGLINAVLSRILLGRLGNISQE